VILIHAFVGTKYFGSDAAMRRLRHGRERVH